MDLLKKLFVVIFQEFWIHFISLINFRYFKMMLKKRKNIIDVANFFDSHLAS